ncbi:glycosyltransferase family 9 protein [Desulfovibrio aminophilus]|nr:glycosyltransferase family 9 protein [Desulfovibrio aminophilus]
MKPILVLQRRRMGDLILSFPLFLWLRRTFPDNPIQVAAEEHFFQPLMSLSPQVGYVPWSEAGTLLQRDYRLVLNLSAGGQAEELAGRARAEEKLGPILLNGARRVLGRWQLYRQSLIQNNRYNRFHWADLNALDLVPLAELRGTAFAEPRRLPPGEVRVGLFLGASEPSKRPGVAFWAELARALLDRGLRPALLGGPAERGLGAEVKRIAAAPLLDLCGKLGLKELAAAGQTFQLLVTPDTGPMHLAAWTGLRVLNLSMGNVNPWETGPYQPGHLVLRPTASCALGCWSCTRGDTRCRGAFSARRTASLVQSMLTGPDERLERLTPPGLALSRTDRDPSGLYRLARLDRRAPGAHRLLSRFWQAYHGHRFGLWDEARPRAAWAELAAAQPRLAEAFRSRLPGLGRGLRLGLSRGALDDAFWTGAPLMLRPLTGFLLPLLQNSDFSSPAWAESLEWLEALLAATR